MEKNKNIYYLTENEKIGIIEIINIIISKRIITDILNYTELIELKNKLYVE